MKGMAVGHLPFSVIMAVIVYSSCSTVCRFVHYCLNSHHCLAQTDYLYLASIQ